MKNNLNQDPININIIPAFTGLLYCTECDSLMYPILEILSGELSISYRCNDDCSIPDVPGSVLHKSVLDIIKEKFEKTSDERYRPYVFLNELDYHLAHKLIKYIHVSEDCEESTGILSIKYSF